MMEMKFDAIKLSLIKMGDLSSTGGHPFEVKTILQSWKQHSVSHWGSTPVANSMLL